MRVSHPEEELERSVPGKEVGKGFDASIREIGHYEWNGF